MSDLRAQFNALLTTPGAHNDPVRLRYLQSLLQRCERSEGALGTRLSARLSSALSAYRAALPAAERHAPKTTGASGCAGLTDLRARLDEQRERDCAPSLDERLQAQERQLVGATHRDGVATDEASTAADAGLRAARRLNQTLRQTATAHWLAQARSELAADAGPLNPQRLAVESIEQLHALSPSYACELLAYLDSLFWLEQADSRSGR